MSIGEIAGSIIGAICFVVWVPCVILWLRKGVSIPRYIHILAGILTAISVACLIGLTLSGMPMFKLAIAFLAIPPAMTYFLWLWMFGPEFSQKQ